MRKFFTLASLVALSMVACTNEESKGEVNEKGSVNFDISVKSDVEVTTRANVSCTTPAVKDFKLKIEGVSHTYAEEYATIAEFNEENHLYSGKYKATVTAGDVAEEGYDKATFVGVKEFAVEARQKTEVVITAYIANTLVKVETTEAFNNYFVGGHSLELTTNSGNKFDVTAQAEPLFIEPKHLQSMVLLLSRLISQVLRAQQSLFQSTRWRILRLRDIIPLSLMLKMQVVQPLRLPSTMMLLSQLTSSRS
jgi:hypothetical protein